MILFFLILSAASVYSSLIIEADQGTTDHLSDDSYVVKFVDLWDKEWGMHVCIYIFTCVLLFDL